MCFLKDLPHPGSNSTFHFAWSALIVDLLIENLLFLLGHAEITKLFPSDFDLALCFFHCRCNPQVSSLKAS